MVSTLNYISSKTTLTIRNIDRYDNTRERFGLTEGEHPTIYKIVRQPLTDPNFMSIDVVINWAADGLVLCFMHAAKDKEARDNDENDKTHWSNWCGTPYLSVEQVQLLYDQLSKRVTPSPTLHRVFQVLLNKPERPLWLSWPPDPPIG